MSKRLQKSFQKYFSKLKGKIHIKPPPFSTDPNMPHSPDAKPTTLGDVDRFLFENFCSLYQQNDDDVDIGRRSLPELGNIETPPSPLFMFESPRFVDSVPEVRATSRFFVSPHRSASLAQEAKLMASVYEDLESFDTGSDTCVGSVKPVVELEGFLLPEETIAVLTSSPDPYVDFRRSMEEMIEARFKNNQPIDWDYLEELLFCYLKLNDKRAYKYVLGAFVDLTTSLRQPKEMRGRKSVSVAGRRKRNHMYY